MDLWLLITLEVFIGLFLVNSVCSDCFRRQTPRPTPLYRWIISD
jgi:hypothetical protein